MFAKLYHPKLLLDCAGLDDYLTTTKQYLHIQTKLQNYRCRDRLKV